MKKPDEITLHSGIILTANKFKDKDCVITIVGEGRKCVYMANSAYALNSKNHIATLVFSHVRISAHGYTNHKSVASISLIKNHIDIYENLFFATALSIIQEMVTNLFIENEEFETSYIESLFDLKSPSDEEILYGVLVSMLHCMEDLGIISLSLLCANCGKQLKITDCFSIHHGGFLCNKCQDEIGAYSTDKNVLKLLINAYKCEDHTFKTNVNKNLLLKVIETLAQYIEESVGYKIKSLANFKKWFFNM